MCLNALMGFDKHMIDETLFGFVKNPFNVKILYKLLTGNKLKWN